MVSQALQPPPLRAAGLIPHVHLGQLVDRDNYFGSYDGQVTKSRNNRVEIAPLCHYRGRSQCDAGVGRDRIRQSPFERPLPRSRRTELPPGSTLSAVLFVAALDVANDTQGCRVI